MVLLWVTKGRAQGLNWVELGGLSVDACFTPVLQNVGGCGRALQCILNWGLVKWF